MQSSGVAVRQAFVYSLSWFWKFPSGCRLCSVEMDFGAVDKLTAMNVTSHVIAFASHIQGNEKGAAVERCVDLIGTPWGLLLTFGSCRSREMLAEFTSIRQRRNLEQIRKASFFYWCGSHRQQQWHGRLQNLLRDIRLCDRKPDST